MKLNLLSCFLILVSFSYSQNENNITYPDENSKEYQRKELIEQSLLLPENEKPILKDSFEQNISIVKCKIWKPESFCDLPDSIKTPGSYCLDCTLKNKTCKQIEKKKNLVGVWITFTAETDTTFVLANKFKNISLVRKNNKKEIRPYAFLHWDQIFSDHKLIFEYVYMTFVRSKNYYLIFKAKTQVDIIFIFPGAEKSDKIVIDNFLQVEITD